MKKQRTIRKSVSGEGAGLFSGAPAKVTLSPGAPDSGVVFVRTDLEGRPRVRVGPETVNSKLRRSAVAGENFEIETIEHLMSAIGGLELDNLEIEISGPEIPNQDGSARPWVDLLRSAEIVEQTEAKRIFAIREPISVTDSEAAIVALPSDAGLTISYTLNYDGTPLGRQHFSVEINERTYADQVAPARTFCLQSEAEALMAQGLGKGGNTKNTLIVGPDGPIDNELRFADEYVRHKVLDLLGDMTTLGATLKAHVVAIRSGHSTNIKLVKKIAAAFEDSLKGEKQREALLDVREILKILPHRYPMLLIDRVIELDGYRRAVGIKNVTFNEPYLQGHFPGQPIMPGVLQIEAMAQLAGALLMRKSENAGKIAVLLSLDGVKLRRTVVPGDQMRIEAEALKIKNRTGEVYTRAFVDGQVVAEAAMKFMLADPE